MRLFLFVFLLILNQVLACELSYKDSFSLDEKKQINKLIKSYKSKYKIPQFQILVGNSNGPIFYKSFNSSKDVLFDLASITKVFSALAFLKILEEKKINYWEKVSKYFKEFQTEEKSELTFEDILRHISGYKPGVLRGNLDPNNTEESFNFIFNLKPTRAYGEFLYSDINYLLIGEFIKRLTNLTINQAFDKYIKIPFELKNTMHHPALKKYKCAPTRKDSKSCVVHDPTSFILGGLTGHAGLFSNINDIARFAQVFLNDGILCGKKVISPTVMDQMTIKDSKYMRGLGFDFTSPYSRRPRGDFFNPGISYGHTGFTGTSLWIDPKLDTYMIVLTNTVGAQNESYAKNGYLELLLKLSNMIGKIRSEI